jgi:hypothetical protein
LLHAYIMLILFVVVGFSTSLYLLTRAEKLRS